MKNTSVEFAIKGAPGDPRFKGELSQDGKTIAGTFSQGGGNVPLNLAWKGEAQFEAVRKNPAVSKALLGTWEGTLDVQGKSLRLVLTLANGPDGATGTLVSLDQNNFEMPVTTIAEEGSRLKLTISMVSGAFDGEIKGERDCRHLDAGRRIAAADAQTGEVVGARGSRTRGSASEHRTCRDLPVREPASPGITDPSSRTLSASNIFWC